MLISHWGASEYFERAAGCLLAAAADPRLGLCLSTLSGDAAFTRRTLTSRVKKALAEKPASLTVAVNGRYSAATSASVKPVSAAQRSAEKAQRAQIVRLAELLL